MDWNSPYVSELVQRALAEDVGSGDATVLATIPASAIGHAHILAKQDVIVAGLPLAKAVLRALDPAMQIEFRAQDGDRVAKGNDLLHLDGTARAILTGERTSLNFLAHLSDSDSEICRTAGRNQLPHQGHAKNDSRSAFA